MKYFYLAFFAILSNVAFAQINQNNIYGTWVNSRVTYKDGVELPAEHPFKNIYIKYAFTKPDKINLSTIYYQTGGGQLFEISANYLMIKTVQGGLINSYRIEALKDTLMLLQAGEGGFDDSSALKFYFVPEAKYQASLKLNPGDIYSIIGADTIYNSSPKIYAAYKGEGFQNYIYNGIRDKISMDNRVGHLAASFIVSKAGIADSLKILEGIDKEFDARFVKVFNQAKKDWKPGMLNGKPVPVKMTVELGYSTSSTVIPAFAATQKANDAFAAKEYSIAIYYYDKALASMPTDKDNLYKRGMCKLLLGNVPWACEDWRKAKALGSDGRIDALLEKYSK